MASTWLKPGVNEVSFTRLLHRIRRHDLHAFDYNALRRLAHFALCISLGRCVTDLVEHIVAFDQFTERRVLPIKPPNGREADEELRSCRVRIGPACHRDDTAIGSITVKVGRDCLTSVLCSV